MRIKKLLAVLLVGLVSGCGTAAPGVETAPVSTSNTGAPSRTAAASGAVATTETFGTTTGITSTSTPVSTLAESGPLAGRGEVELVSDGYGFTEGPQWMAKAGVLRFTDDDTIYEVAAGDKVTIFRRPSNRANGLAADRQGRLIAAEAGARRVTRTESDGTVKPIASKFEGHRLNQPNDIVVRSDGTIYFTDPAFGDAESTAELDFRGVFRIAPDGHLTAERRGDTDEAPNGLALSPDESRLYVTNYAGNLVWDFDVAPDGSLSDAKTFVYVTEPDGMAVDAAGNLFVASANGIAVFADDGTPSGVIEVPKQPANCAFGGRDGRTLYITAQEGVYRVRLAQPGPY